MDGFKQLLAGLEDGKTSVFAKSNHVVTDITKPGKYEADVLDGDAIKDKIILNVQSETQKKSGKNDGFRMFFRRGAN